MKKQLTRLALPLMVASLLACSGLPEQVDSLEQARTDLRELERTPIATRVAASEIAAARDAIATADRAYEERQPLPFIEHQAYIAQRYADIASERAGEATAREQADRAEAERNRIIAEARTREADARTREAEERAQQAEAAERALQVQVAAAEEQARSAAAAEERNEELQRELDELNAERTADRGIVLTIGDVLFDTGAATLKPGAMATMERLAQFMRDYPERSVRIEGHTDSVGSDATNQALSERRADAVRDALVAQNAPSERIDTVGYGESRPIASNDNVAGRQQNRRVEIVVSEGDGSFVGGAGANRAGAGR
jgi:outer membrane protein OmpA-like peptidoglycan-associated protein